MKILVTGGCGFIGSNFVRYLLGVRPDDFVVNLDSLTYAGNAKSLADVEDNNNYLFVHGDITDGEAVENLFSSQNFDLVINFAAESHVDRSLLDSGVFVRTNVLGTQTLLDAARRHKVARFCQVSTDEVYGSLSPTDPAFTELNPITPSSPYSASKAGADHLALACAHSFGMDVVVTRCSNNYGPYQFPEKFIPLFITNALADAELPLYGDGQNVRDWIHVLDHCKGVLEVALRGESGEVYNLGGGNEWGNIDIAKKILEYLDKPESLIKFVKDRPGHDRRYAMDYSRAERVLGWNPEYDFEAGLKETVEWYCENKVWWEEVKSGAYREYYQKQYGDR